MPDPATLTPEAAGARDHRGRVAEATQPTVLSHSRYMGLTTAALALTAGQVLVLPRQLTAREFGIVVLAISVTQGTSQLGALGLCRLCIDGTRSAADRNRAGAAGEAVTMLTVLSFLAVATVLAIARPASRSLLAALSLGALAGATVSAERFRAARLEVDGDEAQAAIRNFRWSNLPKAGLVAGALVFHEPALVVGAGVVAGAVFCAPQWVNLSVGFSALREYRLWGPPFVSIVAGFVLVWADTYFLSAHAGVAQAGAYEATYRVLGVSSYAFLPWASVVTTRVATARPSPMAGPLLKAMAATATSLALAGWLVVHAARSLFPRVDLPVAAVGPLALFYLATAVASCVGAGLYARGQRTAVTGAAVVAAVICLAGHVLFTRGGGAETAAWVAASAMTANAGLQTVAYRHPRTRHDRGGRRG